MTSPFEVTEEQAQQLHRLAAEALETHEREHFSAVEHCRYLACRMARIVRPPVLRG